MTTSLPRRNCLRRTFRSRWLTSALHRKPGTWEQDFGADADEQFAAFSTASYINEVAKAGKAEYPIPMYCNVWLTYPMHALENRNRASAGQEYPSGGPQPQNIDLWKIAAPSIDILAPDIYSDDIPFFRSVAAAYARPDNPLFIPETGLSKSDIGPYFFYPLGHGALGFSPFGVDYTGWSHFDDSRVPEWLSRKNHFGGGATRHLDTRLKCKRLAESGRTG